MAIPFSDNFSIGVGNPIDAKYLNALNQPYANTGETNTRISESQRYIGLTVNIGNVEYWYKNGVNDTDLILKTFSGGTGGGGTITGATNGLSVFGKNIGLGGTITGNTVITDARITPVGIVYNNDYSGTFVDESLITKRYADSKVSGNTFHIPVYNATNNGIQESTLIFSGTTLYNSNYLTVKALNGLYLVGTNGPANTIVTLGYPTLSSGYTISNICVAGQATDIELIIGSKGIGQIVLSTPISSVNIGTTGKCGLAYSPVNRTLTLPQSGTIIGYGGDTVTPNAPASYIIGGHGYAAVGYAGCGGHLFICGGDAADGIGSLNCIGGDIIIESGLGTGTGATTTKKGNIKICNLPAKTSEINVLYYNTTSGLVSHGLASGGTGGGLLTGATNGLSVGGLNVNLGGALCQTTTIVRGVGNIAGIEYGGDYSVDFTDRSLIDKGYADLINQKVSKIITQIGHGFIVGNVIGYSGGTYNKPIADGTYNGEILGLATKVSGNTFELSQAGYVNGLSGLLANTTYFLSDVTTGLMTQVEPTILGHVSKAMLIADSAVSGWMLPYAGYVISTGTTDVGGSNTKRITQSGHTFVVNDVIGWSGGTYNRAIANGEYNGEVIGIVSKVISPNVFDLTQAGYVSGLTGLTTNATYFLSDVLAGKLTPTKTTTLGHVIKSVIVTDTPSSGWVLPYPGFVLTTGNTTSGITVAAGIGMTNVANTFNVNVTGSTAVGSEIPVRINTGGSNMLYIDSNDVSGGTAYTFIQSGATQIYDDGLGNVTIYSPIPTGGTGGTSYTFTPSGATQISTVGNVVTIFTPKSNVVPVYNITGVTTYSATTSDHFIGASGGSIIWLPSTPNIGQGIEVADIGGNAFGSNISICSAAPNKILNDYTATINTDYGSISFRFNGNFWNAVAFIN